MLLPSIKKENVLNTHNTIGYKYLLIYPTSHVDVVDCHGLLEVAMAVVYSGAITNQYDVNNA
jgi:hypothetical protein